MRGLFMRAARLSGLCGLLAVTSVQAHDFRAGALRMDHPYAPPSQDEQGWLCFREVRNTGSEADRLLSASVEQAQGVAAPEGQTLPLTLPAGAAQQWRHSNKQCLRLQGLAQPLRVGDRFEAVLRFERAGEARVQVWVQQPR